MPRSEDRYEYHDKRVSTEPQRKALDAMSDDLVRKLHAMVAEQEQRAREFAAHQHSLSSLPNLQQQFPQQQAFPQPPAPATTKQGQARARRPHSTITNGPRIPQQKQVKNEVGQQPAPFLPDWDAQFNTPSSTRTQPKKESGCGVGTIIVGIIIFLIIFRSCS